MIPLARLAAKMSRTESGTARHSGLPGQMRTGARVPLLPAQPPEVPGGWGILGLLNLWWWRATSRQELAHLSPEQLRDVGIHPRIAKREAEKPFWRG